MNLQSIRDAVRSQLDLDEDDLPDGRLDLYVREAFDRTMSRRSDWPSYATEWTLTLTDGVSAWDADMGAIVDVVYDTITLSHLSHDTARQTFLNGEGSPYYFSTWGHTLYVWPIPDDGETVSVRGWRRPLDWVADGAAAVVDADTLLHLPLVHYACSREYAFQEDEVLESRYLQTWNSGVESAIAAIFRQTLNAPLIMNRGFRLPSRRTLVFDI